MKLKFERIEGAEKLARLLKKPLLEYEGFHRENNGDWIILNEDGTRFGTVTFQGYAKRGQTWNAPDPVGQNIARTLVKLWNAKEEKRP